MLYLIALSFVLGVKHSYDADHLVAVSGYLSKSNSLKHSLRIGLNWAAGHMITATLITFLIYFMKESFIKEYFHNLEYLVGAMLVILGVYSLVDLFHNNQTVRHGKNHSHKDCLLKHHHKHIFGIGIVHGLASNDELLLLFTVSLGLTSLVGILGCVAVFSVGVVAGMCLFALAFTIPVLKYLKIREILMFVSGISGLVYGFSILAR